MLKGLLLLREPGQSGWEHRVSLTVLGNASDIRSGIRLASKGMSFGFFRGGTRTNRGREASPEAIRGNEL